MQRKKSRKSGASPAARLPTALSLLQRMHGTGGSGPGPANQPPWAGKFTFVLAPATSPHSSSQPATMATTSLSKAKKGRNFSSEEERQLCRSFLHVSQDPIAGNGQRAGAFWDRIARHYQDHKPQGREDRPARSLETKWGVIKHDVSKFVAVHSQVLNLKESGTSLEDVLQRALELYRVKHPKQQGFLYIHCWTILKDIPRWFESVVEVRTRQAIKTPPPQLMKRRRLSSELPDALEPTVPVDDDGEECVEVDFAVASRRPQRPTGNKAAKDELHRSRVKENTMLAQAKATAEMAAANAEKVAVMRDQAALQLFSIPDDSAMSDMAREYIHLRREEELSKVKRRVQQTKADFSLGFSAGVAEPHAEPGATGVVAGSGVGAATGAASRASSASAGAEGTDIAPAARASSASAGAKGADIAPAGAAGADRSRAVAVDVPDVVGGAEDTSQNYIVRHAGHQSMQGIHRPPIPFPFFPSNYQNVWGSSVGLGVGVGLGEGCDPVYAPMRPNLDNFSGSGH